jgi:aryl-alcohol dehydrogenase-like predicted oxidoreductase
VIPCRLFGRTGHASSRLLFGAAALARADEAEAARALELLLEHGVNHIDTAAAYGDSELRVGAWMPRHRGDFFLATKTGERGYAGAREGIRRSLERLRTDHVDLLQLHNLVDPEGWERAFGDDGALRAAVEAREEGLVRFLGVTGHGTRVAAMHLRSLERFPFDSVLLPLNPLQMRDAGQAADCARLLGVCHEHGVAVQTIKSIARRRWPEGASPTRTTWYEPLEAQEDVDRAVHWVLAHRDVFVNTASDLVLLERMLSAAERFEGAPPETEVDAAAERLDMAPLFVRGFSAGA